MSKIKVGIIGCGYIASKWHIPGFQRLEKKAIVQAACDISPQLAASTAQEFNIPETYSVSTEMFQKENLDVVDICTPPGTHASLAIQAMESGCHVLLEKPMALKLSDCDEIIRISQKTGKKLCIIHNELFRPPIIAAKKLIEKGAIGKVAGMEWCRFVHKEEYLAKANHWIHKLPGGIIGETGPHAVYASLAFLKKIKNVEIAAKSIMKYPWAQFDYFNITLEGEDINSSVIMTHACDNYVAEMSIFGTEGMLKLDLQGMLLTKYRLKKAKPVSLAVASLKPAGQIIGGVFSNAAKIVFTRDAMLDVTGHATEIEQFVDSIRNDQRPPVTGEEGRETIRVVELLVQKLAEKYGVPPS